MVNPLNVLPHEEIGWSEIGEQFTRYRLLVTPWFRVFLHRLWCPMWHPQGHDHPWSFVAIVLKGGYLERTQKECRWRGQGSVLYRPAEFVHNVVTGRDVNWSIVITGPKRRQWGFVDMKPVHGFESEVH
jgi:hypothetical protein